MHDRPLVLVGITGGIALYKTCTLIRLLMNNGCDVQVVATPEAFEFVGRTTFESLTGHPVFVDVHSSVAFQGHVELSKKADLFVIAPATRNILAKLAHGITDNALTLVYSNVTCPVVCAPAMHTHMWESYENQENIKVLTKKGVFFLSPQHGALTSGDVGVGRMQEPDAIFSYVRQLLDVASSWSNKKILITAGGTREPIDPIRYIGNSSTGLFGVEIALEASRRGADVTLIACNIDSSLLMRLSSKVTVFSASTTRELKDLVDRSMPHSDVIFMAAAVSDYRVINTSDVKNKKNGTNIFLELTENPDILKGLARTYKGKKLLIGFAAETGDNIYSSFEYAQKKAKNKGVDFIVFNEVGSHKGFGHGDTSVHVINDEGKVVMNADGEKKDIACELASFITPYINEVMR